MSVEARSGPEVYVPNRESRRLAVESHDEIMQSREMTAFAEGRLKAVKPVVKVWHPSDREILPDLHGPDGLERLYDFREEIKHLSLGFWTVAIGHGITEGNIASYPIAINRHAGISDKTGTDQGPFPRFLRDWTGQENRHSQVLDKLLYISGVPIMREVEKSTHSLIRNGLNPLRLKEGDEHDSYEFIFYASLQEANTKIASQKAGKIALREGSPRVHRIFTYIGAEEGVHENFYVPVGKKILEMDPEGGVVALRNVLVQGRKGLEMPGALMTSGEDVTSGPTDLFTKLVRVENFMDGFTAEDFEKIYNRLVETWGIENLQVDGKEAEEAKAQILEHREYNKRLTAAGERMRKLGGTVDLPWFDEPVVLIK